MTSQLGSIAGIAARPAARGSWPKGCQMSDSETVK
jgi:hypothetical protein